MKGKPDLNEFLSGGEADKAEQPVTRKASKPKSEIQPEPVKQPKIYKEQKLYRLPTDLIEGLREMAYEKSKTEARRVTETEIVEQAIRKYIDSYL